MEYLVLAFYWSLGISFGLAFIHVLVTLFWRYLINTQMQGIDLADFESADDFYDYIFENGTTRHTYETMWYVDKLLKINILILIVIMLVISIINFM
jgi:hypothetical protein